MPRILIIDDEPDLRLALTVTLEDYGYDVVEGIDGSEALELAVDHRPDAIILDVNMPVVDGLTALKILKADARTSGIPVCILTAVRDPAQEQYAAELGADDFFAKPWSEDQMMRSLANIIERRAAESRGSTSADTCARYGSVPALAELLKIDRNERLSQIIQARHDTWTTWD